MKPYLLALAIAVICAAPAAAEPVDLGVMGSDGIIRSEADAEAFEASTKKNEPPKKNAPLILPQIILKTQKQVQMALGKPVEPCTKGKYGLKCAYKNGQIEVVYINGKADWITYNDPPVGFYPPALQQLGVSCPVSPSRVTVTDDMIAWQGTCPGLVSAQIFAGGPATVEGGSRKVFYIYLKAATQ